MACNIIYSVTFHYLVFGDGTTCILTVQKEEAPLRTVWAMLEAIKGDISQNNSMSNMKKSLQTHMDKYNDPASDKITKIQGKVEEVKEKMVENIDKV